MKESALLNVEITLEDGARNPVYATQGAAGADIHAFLPNQHIILAPGAYSMIPTGVRMAIPEGYEVQVRPRSGLAAKFGVTVLNSPGTIDSDYRGEVKVILINHGNSPYTVQDGERIAQLILSPVTVANYALKASLDASERGDGGFGSTGI